MNPSYTNGGIYSSGSEQPVIPSVPKPAPSMTLQSGGVSSRSKKGGLVIGLILVVLAIVLGVAAVMMQNGGKNSSSSDARQALSDVTNYMYFGTVDTSAEGAKTISSFNPETDVAEFVRISTDGDYAAQQEFFGKALEYANALNDSIGDNSAKQEATDLRNATVALKEFSGIVYSGALFSTYLSDGKAGLEKYKTEIEATGLEDSDDYKTIVILGKSMITEAEKYYQKYADSGCIKDGALDSECVDALVENDSEIVKMQSELTRLRVNIRKDITNIQGKVTDDLKKLNKELGGSWYE